MSDDYTDSDMSSPANSAAADGLASAFNFGSVVKIFVSYGYDERVFNLHEQVLAKYSKFFERAFRIHEGMHPSWPDANTREFEVIEFNAATFLFFANWLYLTKVPFENKLRTMTDEARASCFSDDLGILVDQYLLGGFLEAREYQNDVVSSLIKRLHTLREVQLQMADEGINTFNRTLLGPDIIKEIYLGTPPGSPLRLLATKWHAWSTFPSRFVDEVIWHPEFVEDVNSVVESIRFHPLLTQGPPWAESVCQYHEHLPGELCEWEVEDTPEV